ncbi:MAG: TlyA family RNA methyltransferase [Sulfurimonas sp.]|nr:TlyA family RNA methyltransferase [Sulfurimonas sp.]
MSRLDSYLVQNDYIDSRTKAQSIIKSGLVSVDEKIIKKSSFIVSAEDVVSVKEHEQFVSRAAYKLKYFLEELELDVRDKICLDIGSSTGGFTQVLLKNGVKEVTAVDVGSNQLHKSLKDDDRVYSFENCDIREFKSDKNFNLVVSDVAFISLLNILNEIDILACENIILLFKPQFEVGRKAKRDNNGIVIDDKAIKKAKKNFEVACEKKGWKLILKSPSKLTGKEGNLEYCYYYKKLVYSEIIMI